MIIIYDQDKTYIYNDLGDAEETIIALYGAKLGREACTAMKNGRTGTVYRQHGGPRVEIVSEADAERSAAERRPQECLRSIYDHKI